ncbi:MAG TPA: transglycosylase SLT domain-containing protein, partial [Parvibaculum sp.]
MLRVTGKRSEPVAVKPVIGWRIAATMGLALAIAPTLALSQTQRPTTEIPPALAKPSPWTYCERATVLIEAAHKMPRALLYSVAMVESGRLNPELRKPRPWPWTINAEGAGSWFETKAEALTAVRTLRSRGVRSIDVGCMQVNLMHHPDAFPTLEAAFEPISNAGYAARFLTELHDQSGDWMKAAASYHSSNPS